MAILSRLSPDKGGNKGFSANDILRRLKAGEKSQDGENRPSSRNQWRKNATKAASEASSVSPRNHVAIIQINATPPDGSRASTAHCKDYRHLNTINTLSRLHHLSFEDGMEEKRQHWRLQR